MNVRSCHVPGRPGRSRVERALGIVALTLACTTSNAADMHVSSPPSGPTTPLYAGRFMTIVPAGVTPAGEEAELQDLEVKEVAWPTEVPPGPPGRPARDAATRAWAERLAELRADPDKRPEGAADVVIQQRQLAPNLWLLYRHDGRVNDSLVAAEALLDAGPNGVWIRAPYQRGAEGDVITIFTRLARSYRPYPPQAPRAEDQAAFHLSGGAFYLPFDFQESLESYLNLEAHGLKTVHLTLRSGADPEWGEGLVAEWRAKQRSSLLGRLLGAGKATLVRAGPCTVAGMPGEEVVARFDRSGEPPELALTWGYRGENDAPTRPHTVISATSVDGRVGDAVAAWDRLLGSVRVLPRNAEAALAGVRGARWARPEKEAGS